MLVRKINPDWQPSENKGLKVGDTIEITDPRSLILSGYVAAVDSNGVEISSYDLYGVISKDEKKDFEEYLQMKKATALKDVLEKEQEALKAEAAKLEASKAPEKPAETIAAVEPAKTQTKK